MSRAPTIALTGGGTAGHVMPHFALMPDFKKAGWNCFYIGSNGIERDLVAKQGIPFFTIKAGKLRRYFSVQNFFDIFKIGVGFFQSIAILLVHRPKAVFSKGGFVSVPVAIAAWVLRIPVITHESDLTPGLANRIIGRFAKKILYSFPETKEFIDPARGVLVGSPVRDELFKGDRNRAYTLCGFDSKAGLPFILVMGGSLGAVNLNKALEQVLPALAEKYFVVHVTGKGKKIPFQHPRYCAFEYVGSELSDIFAATDVVISRAGANAVFEFLSLEKPMLLIPLVAGSRGDQVLNAHCFAAHGWAHVLEEKHLSPESFLAAISKLFKQAESMKEAQLHFNYRETNSKVIDAIKSTFN
jgi:UDP-N-acetylglucosamine--N-acetylmuramyl-(pentapeptide) pyrophosphoryl-undecaprenol N-acetylglucosamine transferase